MLNGSLYETLSSNDFDRQRIYNFVGLCLKRERSNEQSIYADKRNGLIKINQTSKLKKGAKDETMVQNRNVCKWQES